jgi:hypothetical protein
MKASICIATYDKADLLDNTLKSIFQQHPPFDFEVIVVDDGSPGANTNEVCNKYPVRYHRVDREPGFRNPCTARNIAYRMAKGEVIVAQSDEVIHTTLNCLERLVEELKPKTFVIATVTNVLPSGVIEQYTGNVRREPFFFLGSLYRQDLYAVGGNDEEFACGPAYEDAWFGHCLTMGLGLAPMFSATITGQHQYHKTRSSLVAESPSRTLYFAKVAAANKRTIPWLSSSGPWGDGEIREDADVEKIFTNIYHTNPWGCEESHSGAGSTILATMAIREAIPKFIEKYEIKSILDLPCGDFNWMRKVDLGVDRYIGGDVVKILVDENNKKYAKDGIEFRHLDLLSDALPHSDLVLCRDCLGHLSFADVQRAINNIVKSGARYLLATTFTDRTSNCYIKTGDWTPYNLRKAPFDLPEPIEIINEGCIENYPEFTDKNLALWRLPL